MLFPLTFIIIVLCNLNITKAVITIAEIPQDILQQMLEYADQTCLNTFSVTNTIIYQRMQQLDMLHLLSDYQFIQLCNKQIFKKLSMQKQELLFQSLKYEVEKNGHFKRMLKCVYLAEITQNKDFIVRFDLNRNKIASEHLMQAMKLKFHDLFEIMLHKIKKNDFSMQFTMLRMLQFSDKSFQPSMFARVWDEYNNIQFKKNPLHLNDVISYFLNTVRCQRYKPYVRMLRVMYDVTTESIISTNNQKSIQIRLIKQKKIKIIWGIITMKKSIHKRQSEDMLKLWAMINIPFNVHLKQFTCMYPSMDLKIINSIFQINKILYGMSCLINFYHSQSIYNDSKLLYIFETVDCQFMQDRLSTIDSILAILDENIQRALFSNKLMDQLQKMQNQFNPPTKTKQRLKNLFDAIARKK